MSIDVSAEPAGIQQARARWRAAVAGVLTLVTAALLKTLGRKL